MNRRGFHHEHLVHEKSRCCAHVWVHFTLADCHCSFSFQGGDEARLSEFVLKTRDYGKGDLKPEAFWTYLVATFNEPRALVFLPKLARLVPDGELRRALLKAPKLAATLSHNEQLPTDIYESSTRGPAAVKFNAAAPVPGAGVGGGGGGGGGGGAAVPPLPPPEEENPFAPARGGASGGAAAEDGAEVLSADAKQVSS